MARKVRLEYAGAIYHVINRGNYRAWVFREEEAKAAFEACLFEACARCGWILHAYVVMGNHYHLAVETPEPNLSVGMHWLQATYGNRFNRFRGESGHLFQGRYKALPVEGGDALGQVCHYIHLNPVRAGIVAAERLDDYRYSSYWYLTRLRSRPRFLVFKDALASAGLLPDSGAGWRSYGQYLEWQAAEGPAGKNQAYASMTEGWAIGSSDFKRALLEEHAQAVQAKAWEGEGAQEWRKARWEAALKAAVGQLSKEERSGDEKSAGWKTAIARYLKETTDVTNDWLAERLGMGSGFYVSKHVGLLRRGPATAATKLYAKLKVKGKA